MTRSTRRVLAIFAALSGASLWLVLTYGAVRLLGLVLDLGGVSEGARTLLITGILALAMAGAAVAAMISYALLAEAPPSPHAAGSDESA